MHVCVIYACTCVCMFIYQTIMLARSLLSVLLPPLEDFSSHMYVYACIHVYTFTCVGCVCANGLRAFMCACLIDSSNGLRTCMCACLFVPSLSSSLAAA
jgi:hypothetical protein